MRWFHLVSGYNIWLTIFWMENIGYIVSKCYLPWTICCEMIVLIRQNVNGSVVFFCHKLCPFITVEYGYPNLPLAILTDPTSDTKKINIHNNIIITCHATISISGLFIIHISHFDFQGRNNLNKLAKPILNPEAGISNYFQKTSWNVIDNQYQCQIFMDLFLACTTDHLRLDHQYMVI